MNMLLKINEKQQCPRGVRDDFVKGWGYKGYISFHRRLAEDELTAICSFSGAKIHNEWMEDDGWLDGFECLHAVIETVAGRLLKVKYHDGNQAFMRRCDGGGWASMSPQDLDNDDFTNLMKMARERDEREAEKKHRLAFNELF